MSDEPHPAESGELLKPELYAESAGGTVTLAGGACECGYLFFPWQRYGCERCGGTTLRRKPLVARGILRSSATVHVFRGEGYEVPFTVGSIALDEGPVIRALVEGDGLPVGQRVEGRIQREVGEQRDLIFVPL
mgnify:CR=1 FL=1